MPISRISEIQSRSDSGWAQSEIQVTEVAENSNSERLKIRTQPRNADV